jgi:aspartyl/asparaginyl-tRNA synthetase
MFEFELKGGMDELRALEKELLEYLGFRKNENGEYPGDDYDNIAGKYGVKELEHEHETKLDEEYGSVFFLENFPEYTSPFWNMRLQENGTHSNKIDVIIHGMETIGSAERSTSPKEMKEKFETISEGGYAGILYDQFGKERVQNELDEFLKYDFFQRSGGGIGMTRMIRAMKLSNILV